MIQGLPESGSVEKTLWSSFPGRMIMTCGGVNIHSSPAAGSVAKGSVLLGSLPPARAHPGLPPPLHKLSGVGERLEHPLGRSSDNGLDANGVLIGRKNCSCHERCSLLI